MQTTKLRLLAKQADAEYNRYLGGSLYGQSRRGRVPHVGRSWPKDTFFSHIGIISSTRKGLAYSHTHDPAQMRKLSLDLQSREGLSRLA